MGPPAHRKMVKVRPVPYLQTADIKAHRGYSTVRTASIACLLPVATDASSTLAASNAFERIIVARFWPAWSAHRLAFRWPPRSRIIFIE